MSLYIWSDPIMAFGEWNGNIMRDQVLDEMMGRKEKKRREESRKELTCLCDCTCSVITYLPTL